MYAGADDTDPMNRYRDPATGIPLDTPGAEEPLAYVFPSSRGGFGRRAAQLALPPTPSRRRSEDHEPSILRELISYVHLPCFRSRRHKEELKIGRAHV